MNNPSSSFGIWQLSNKRWLLVLLQLQSFMVLCFEIVLGRKGSQTSPTCYSICWNSFFSKVWYCNYGNFQFNSVWSESPHQLIGKYGYFSSRISMEISNKDSGTWSGSGVTFHGHCTKIIIMVYWQSIHRYSGSASVANKESAMIITIIWLEHFLCW